MLACSVLVVLGAVDIVMRATSGLQDPNKSLASLTSRLASIPASCRERKKPEDGRGHCQVGGIAATARGAPLCALVPTGTDSVLI